MMFPAVVPRDEPEEQAGEQRGPDLPADGVFVAAEEIRQLKRLFDFLEEDLDSPSALIELADAKRRPVEVVGQELHFSQFPLHLDFGRN